MPIKIGGDTLALDRDIRRLIEAEAAKLAARFPGDELEANATIQEEFDPLHGHRVRCELAAKLTHGRPVIVRGAHKTASEAINEVFNLARRNLRRARRSVVHPATSKSATFGATAVGG
ncbi:Fis family transcriptional regulator [Thiocapsa imhoffii]|uniref:Fis family transcriptional regulator n=1 Tax=Thiocapsa imhoffii TaxID=382777 RepID=A0A9X0WIW7_9GAMM|nr:HPF/RaiA family ribosome-associated protein [Thiocapsa imhoffii]MBK1645388.1 Fis family transcriptional regulator [Thiocapsa imhoffii]